MRNRFLVLLAIIALCACTSTRRDLKITGLAATPDSVSIAYFQGEARPKCEFKEVGRVAIDRSLIGIFAARRDAGIKAELEVEVRKVGGHGVIKYRQFVESVQQGSGPGTPLRAYAGGIAIYFPDSGCMQ